MATLYRKYRPQTFDQVIGQDHVVLTLKSAIKSGRVSHAYLFCGPRGVGKTTLARILAKAVNCTGKGEKPCGKCQNCLAIAQGNFVDLIEIDAASNRGIDEIRELRDKIRFAPSIGKMKVYIIDEVHMLTREAFNALLKTLEEPPAHSIFIFATTEANKVPETVVSRCQRFDFRFGDDSLIKQSIKEIARGEKLKISDEIVSIITRASGGSFRDAQSLLDQLSSRLANEEISAEQARELLHLSGADKSAELLDLIAQGKTIEALEFVSALQDLGLDFGQFLERMIVEVRGNLIAKITAGEDGAWERKVLTRLIEASEQAKSSPIDTLVLELAIIDLCKGEVTVSNPTNEVNPETEVSKPSKPKKLSSLNFDQEKKAAIVETVGMKNKPLASLLGQSQWHYEDGELKISVEYVLYKDKIMAQKSRQILDSAIAEVMGNNVKINCDVVSKEDLSEEIDSVFAI